MWSSGLFIIWEDDMMKIGDIVWGFDNYENLQTGVVKKVEEATTTEGKKVYVTFGTGFILPVERVYLSKKECIREHDIEIENRVLSYCSEITTIEDLVTFMYNHCVACAEEYTDWAAREASRRKALVLLGMEL